MVTPKAQKKTAHPAHASIPTESKLPPFLRVQKGAILISVKAQPRAHRTELAGLLGIELKIKVAAPPVDSAANEALLRFLAETLGCPNRAVTLLRGATSSHKQFMVNGLSAADVAVKLSGHENPPPRKG